MQFGWVTAEGRTKVLEGNPMCDVRLYETDSNVFSLALPYTRGSSQAILFLSDPA